MDLQRTLDLYRDLCKIPIVSDGYFENSGDQHTISVRSIWNQTDLIRNERTKFARDYVITLDKQHETHPIVHVSSPQALNENSRSISSTGKLTAILNELAPKKRCSSAKQPEKSEFVEIFTRFAKETTIDLKSLEKHGKIHTEFGSPRFSYGEGHLLYIAEKYRKPASFFDTKKKPEEDEKLHLDPKDDEYAYKQNWGEQLAEIKEPVICILNIHGGDVTILDNIPENISPCQPVWAPSDEGVIFVGLNETPSKLGYTYCFNRKSSLYYYNIASATCQSLTDYEAAMTFLRFSPDCSKFVFIESKMGGAHKKSEILKMFDWSTKSISTVVDIVHSPDNDATAFFGLFDVSLPYRCWSTDNQRVVLTSIARSKTEIFVVNVNNGKITCLTDKGNKYGSWRLLDVHRDLLLAQNSSPNRPPTLLFARLPNNGQERDLVWTKLDQESPRPFETLLKEICWDYVAFKRSPVDGEPAEFADLQYEGILITPAKSKNGGNNKPAPLIAMPHGGPHSTYTATWLPATALFALSGFAALRINYRGSLGFGENFVQSLPGRVGLTDVLDCKHALDSTLPALLGAETELNRSKPHHPVFLFGGSHGGFLTTHLIGQFPDYFKAAVAMNPVINFATVLGSSDIPDWAFFEAFGKEYDQSSAVNDEQMKVMWRKSPIAHAEKVRIPLMLLVGENDLRVPPSQIKEYARILSARNVPLRILHYPSNNHGITSVDAEANLLINALRWFDQYLE